MELEPELILPPHDIAVEYKELINTLFSDQKGLDDEAIKKLEQRWHELTEQYSFSYTPIYENGKIGLKSYTDEIVIPARYDDFSLLCCPNDDEFPCKTIMAKMNGKCGLVSMDGSAKELTQFIYDGWHYDPGSYLVSIDGKCGIISEEGETILPCEYNEIRTAPEFWACYKDGLHCFVEYQGESYLVTECIFSDSHFNDNGNLTVKYQDKWGFIAEDGTFTEDENKAHLKKDVEYDEMLQEIMKKLDIKDLEEEDDADSDIYNERFPQE